MEDIELMTVDQISELIKGPISESECMQVVRVVTRRFYSSLVNRTPVRAKQCLEILKAAVAILAKTQTTAFGSQVIERCELALAHFHISIAREEDA